MDRQSPFDYFMMAEGKDKKKNRSHGNVELEKTCWLGMVEQKEKNKYDTVLH